MKDPDLTMTTVWTVSGTASRTQSNRGRGWRAGWRYWPLFSSRTRSSASVGDSPSGTLCSYRISRPSASCALLSR